MNAEEAQLSGSERQQYERIIEKLKRLVEVGLYYKLNPVDP
jgi:hypothetical protein